MLRIEKDVANPTVLLADRVARNGVLFLQTRDRLQTVRAIARQRQDDSARLRQELRQGLACASERLSLARSWQRQARRWATQTCADRTPIHDLDAVRSRLHERYSATGDLAVRAELMASYDGFARSLALRYRHRESVDDLIQVARIGLLHAIDRFDPALGRPFALFARMTITGELKRHLRDRTWAMRVPRSLKEDYLTVMRAVDDLSAGQASSPSVAMVADHCGISEERVLESMELRTGQRVLSIDGPASLESDDVMIDLGEEDVGFEHLENHELLARLLSRLSERDRRIIGLRFVKEMTQSEIAAEIGVSQMCVSRVLARTLGRLRLLARTFD